MRLHIPTSLLQVTFISIPKMASQSISPLTIKSQQDTNEQNAPAPAGKLIYAPGATPSAYRASQFTKSHLSRSDLLPTPHAQFAAWFAAARSSGIPQVEGCTLSTASLPSGRVSARIVYLKELDDEGGFVVYSNWDSSRKASDVATNAFAALTFWWREEERQVRVEGTVNRISQSQAQAYFDTRVRGSKIGAWASKQSEVLDDREQLDERVREVEKRFEGQDHIPCPEFWGGIRIWPESVEFWQGRESRLHDRFRYVREEEGKEKWKIERLSP
jgi:pyridoxamine 5'-phosphate oxidase